MLARIKAAIKSQDRWTRLAHFIFAGVLFHLPVSLRKRLYTGDQFFCPICETSLVTFLVLHRPYHLWCPICRSLQRPRMGWLFLNSSFIEISRHPTSMLHVAPEPSLAARLVSLENLDYLSADLYDPKAMVKMDITDIHYPRHSFDLIYCSHVLEHVSNDHKALTEFWRVLKPGGKAILMVPIQGETTFEDPSITDPVERQKVYGQHDHVRNYGIDFKNRIEVAGFNVTLVKSSELVKEEEIQKMGLPLEEIIFLCTRNDVLTQ